MWSLQFWKDLAERALKTAAQAVLTGLGGNIADFWHLDPRQLLGFALGGLSLSVLMSLGSNALPLGNAGTASMTKAVQASSRP